jgi:hypothetical protein
MGIHQLLYINIHLWNISIQIAMISQMMSFRRIGVGQWGVILSMQDKRSLKTISPWNEYPFPCIPSVILCFPFSSIKNLENELSYRRGLGNFKIAFRFHKILGTLNSFLFLGVIPFIRIPWVVCKFVICKKDFSNLELFKLTVKSFILILFMVVFWFDRAFEETFSTWRLFRHITHMVCSYFGCPDGVFSDVSEIHHSFTWFRVEVIARNRHFQLKF